jgi:hypothetical protein
VKLLFAATNYGASAMSNKAIHSDCIKLYQGLLDILNYAKIRRQSDVIKLTTLDTRFRLGEFISSDKYTWVKEIFNLVEKYYPSVLTFNNDSTPPRIVSEWLYGTWGHHTWKSDDRIFSIRAKYACIFPSKLLYITPQFIYWGIDDEFWIPIDFVVYLVVLAPLLKENICTLLPSRINYKDDDLDFNLSYTRISTRAYIDNNVNIAIPAFGHGYEDLVNTVMQQSLTLPEIQLLEIPWLLGARLEDYVDIIKQNPDELYLYSSSIGKFFEAQPDSPDTISSWIADVAVATKQLDIVFKNKKRELRAREMDVAIGTLCAAASLLLPDTMETIKTALATLFSTKTAYELWRGIYDYRQAKDLLSAEKAWVLWRMRK